MPSEAIITSGFADRQFHDVLGNRMDRHHAALLAVARESGGRETLAGGRPLQVAERDAALPPCQPWLKIAEPISVMPAV